MPYDPVAHNRLRPCNALVFACCCLLYLLFPIVLPRCLSTGSRAPLTAPGRSGVASDTPTPGAVIDSVGGVRLSDTLIFCCAPQGDNLPKNTHNQKSPHIVTEKQTPTEADF